MHNSHHRTKTSGKIVWVKHVVFRKEKGGGENKWKHEVSHSGLCAQTIKRPSLSVSLSLCHSTFVLLLPLFYPWFHIHIPSQHYFPLSPLQSCSWTSFLSLSSLCTIMLAHLLSTADRFAQFYHRTPVQRLGRDTKAVFFTVGLQRNWRRVLLGHSELLHDISIHMKTLVCVQNV